MTRITGIILAGGKSSRMGTDKALVLYKGKPLLEWTAELMTSICDSILISTNNSKHQYLGYETVKDIYKDVGPIGGLFSALTVSLTSANLICACDMPYLTEGLFHKILEKSNKYDAVIAALPGRKVTPTVGYYNKSVALHLEKQIKKGDLKLLNALKGLSIDQVIVKNEKILKNINYPGDIK